MTVFAALIACVGDFGVTIAADRASSRESFVRTLPVGVGPQVVEHLVTRVVTVTAGVIPVVLVAGLLTTATATSVDREFLPGADGRTLTRRAGPIRGR